MHHLSVRNHQQRARDFSDVFPCFPLGVHCGLAEENGQVPHLPTRRQEAPKRLINEPMIHNMHSIVVAAYSN